MNYWLVKSEPHKYPITQLQKDGVTCWDGVRNHQARNNLRAMKSGEFCLYYHSNEGREIVGLARVHREAYPDPGDSQWLAVDLAFVEIFPQSLGLHQLKAHPLLSRIELIRQSRLSVLPVRPGEFEEILKLTHP